MSITMNNLVATRITTHETFATLRDEWNDLLERSKAKSVFLTWEWLYLWHRHLGQDVELSLIVIRNAAGSLIGIAPFCISRQSAGIRALRFMGSLSVGSEYLDVICDPACEKEVAVLVTETLLADRGRWDMLVLSDVLESALVLRVIQGELRARKTLLDLAPAQQCPYLSLPDRHDAFLQSLGGETRSALKRRTRKLTQMGAEVGRVESAEALTPQLETLFGLHGKRWGLRGRTGNLAQQHIREFHLDVARHFLDKGWLWLYSLRLNDAIVASLYTYRYGGKIYYYQSGFDPDWAAISPGFVLMGRCIEDAIGDKLTEFDYLRGLEAYKDRWTRTRRSTLTLTAVPAGRYRGMIYLRQKQLLRSVKRLIKRMLPRSLLPRH